MKRSVYLIVSATLFFWSGKASSELYVTKFDNRSNQEIILKSDSNNNFQVNPQSVSDYRQCSAGLAISADKHIAVYKKNRKIGDISKGTQCDLAAWNVTVCSSKNKKCDTQCLGIDESHNYIAIEIAHASDGNLYFSDSIPATTKKKKVGILAMLKELIRVIITLLSVKS